MRLVSMFFCTVCAAAPNVPVFFVANSGQAPNWVRFLAKGPEVTAYLLPREIQLCAPSTRILVQFPGANPSARVSWSHQLSPADAKQFLPKEFLAGRDHWNPEAEAATLP